MGTDFGFRHAASLKRFGKLVHHHSQVIIPQPLRKCKNAPWQYLAPLISAIVKAMNVRCRGVSWPRASAPAVATYASRATGELASRWRKLQSGGSDDWIDGWPEAFRSSSKVTEANRAIGIRAGSPRGTNTERANHRGVGKHEQIKGKRCRRRSGAGDELSSEVKSSNDFVEFAEKQRGFDLPAKPLRFGLNSAVSSQSS
jgi:hypothetical protein